jgi:D-arabinitol dehydrogenase (NADP+)
MAHSEDGLNDMAPETMTAAVLTAPGRFEVKRVPVPQCGPDDVLIKVLRVRRVRNRRAHFSGTLFGRLFAIDPGSRVLRGYCQVGERVTALKVGQRVIGDINIG